MASSLIFDTETAVTLRDVTDGAETASAAEVGVAFDPDNYDYVVVAINVTAIDSADADETYVLTVESDTAAAETNNVAQATLPNIRAIGTGMYQVVLHAGTIKKLDSDAAYLRVKATLGGTTPSITYGAWLAPVKGGR